jgi:hypothetical protein
MLILIFDWKYIILQRRPTQKQTMNDICDADALGIPLRSAIPKKEIGIFVETEVPASRQCAAAYFTCDDEAASRHRWNAWSHHVILGHFQRVNISYEGKNLALTLKWNRPPPQPYARCLGMTWCMSFRSGWGAAKMYSMLKALLRKGKGARILEIIR